MSYNLHLCKSFLHRVGGYILLWKYNNLLHVTPPVIISISMG